MNTRLELQKRSSTSALKMRYLSTFQTHQNQINGSFTRPEQNLETAVKVIQPFTCADVEMHLKLLNTFSMDVRDFLNLLKKTVYNSISS